MMTAAKHTRREHPRPRSAAVDDDIVAYLSDLGYRDTEPRLLVSSVAAAQGRPFTAEKLCASLPCAGRATVYRSFRPLVETDRVCRVLLEDRELRYQLSQPEQQHHLLCGACGASADLEGCHAEDMLREAAAAAGFRMSGHSLEADSQRGECPED